MIGDREEEGRDEKLRIMRKIEGRIVNRREERVFIVAQAAMGRHTRSGGAKLHGVIHRYSYSVYKVKRWKSTHPTDPLNISK
jgi:hypothetical protein